MIDNNYDILVKFNQPSSVEISRIRPTDKNQWNALVREFTGKISEIDLERFEVSFNEFYKKRKWLTVWKSWGQTYLLEENLKKKLSDVKDEVTSFKLASKGIENFPKHDFTFLKLKRYLTKHQQINISAMLPKGNGANFSVPGAGKTTTSLITWKYLQTQKKVGKLLVICPKSAFYTWCEQEPSAVFQSPPTCQIFDENSIGEEVEILVTNYEKLETSHRVERLIKWITKHHSMLIVDEAHRIKGGINSIRWLSCKRLAEVASRVDLLTGTPMPQSYEDLRNLLNLSWRNLPDNYLTDTILSSLKRGGIFVRTTKEELDLPPVELKEISIEQGKIQEQVYSALKKSYHGLFSLNKNQEEFLGRKGRAAMTLIATATNPGLIAGLSTEDAYLNLRWPPQAIKNDVDLMEIIEKYISIEIPPKYIWLMEFLKTAKKEKRKVLVWSSFVGNLLALNRMLKDFNPALIYGAVDFDSRKNELNKFQKDESCNVLLTNPQTLGEGISLHKFCHEAVYIDRTYNAGQYLQSLDRIHRLGLEKNILTKIYILSSKRSIDNRVNSRLERKIVRMSEMLEDKGLMVHGSLDSDEWSSDGFNSDDYYDLFSHLSSDD